LGNTSEFSGTQGFLIYIRAEATILLFQLEIEHPGLNESHIQICWALRAANHQAVLGPYFKMVELFELQFHRGNLLNQLLLPIFLGIY